MPKTEDIAKYVLDHNVKVEDLLTILNKYKAASLLPSIYKKALYIEKSRHPDPIVESSHQLDSTTMESITSHYALTTPTLIHNSNLLGGYRIVKDYKMYEYSMSGILNRLFA